MKIALATAALADSASFRHLTALAWLFADLRHRWIVEDPNEVRASSWLASEGPTNRRAFAEMADKAARKLDPPELRVGPVGSSCARHETGWHAPADLAEKIAREPLFVLVENAKCDGAFLQKIALRVGKRKLQRTLGDDAFDRLREEWRDPLGDGDRLKVVHGGGNNTAPQLKLLAGTQPPLLRRVFVVVDSDRTRPDAPLGSTAAQVSRACGEVRQEYGPRIQLDLKILEKREVENYLPAEALRAYRGAAFERWQQFSVIEKDFADLKAHFGDKLWHVLCEPSHDGHFHDKSLRERAGVELDDLIDRLARLL